MAGSLGYTDPSTPVGGGPTGRGSDLSRVKYKPLGPDGSGGKPPTPPPDNISHSDYAQLGNLNAQMSPQERALAASFTGPGGNATPIDTSYYTKQEQQQAAAATAKIRALQLEAYASAGKLKRAQDLAKAGPDGIKAVQALLTAKGYYSGPIDAKAGPDTQTAWTQYYTDISKGIEKNLKDSMVFYNQRDLINNNLQKNGLLDPLKYGDTTDPKNPWYNSGIPTTKGSTDVISAADARQELVDYATRQTQAAEAQILALRQKDPKLQDPQDQQAVNGLLSHIATLGAVRNHALDPLHGYDNIMVRGILTDIAHSVLSTWRPGDKEEKSGAVGIAATHALTIVAHGLGPVSTVLDGVFNRGERFFAAAMIDAEHGGNALEQVRAGLGSLLSFVRLPIIHIQGLGEIIAGGGRAQQSINATNTPVEQANLTSSGDLLSIGQILSGHVTEAFHLKYPNAKTFATSLTPENVKVVKGFDPASALIDILTIPLKDPTILLLGGANSLVEDIGTRIGQRTLRTASQETIDHFGPELTQQFGRQLYLSQSKIGRRIVNTISDAVEHVTNAFDLTKALPELDMQVALEAMAAKAAVVDGTTDEAMNAAKKVIQQAFVEGIYHPKFSAVAQLVLATGVGVDTEARFASGLTGKIARLREFVAPRSNTATVFETAATEQVRGANEVATQTIGTTARAYFKEYVAPIIEHLGLTDRFQRAEEIVRTLDNPVLSHAWEGFMRPWFDNKFINAERAAIANEMTDGAYHAFMNTVTQQRGFEAALMDFETALQIAKSQGPEGRQFAAELTGFLLPKNAELNAVSQAILNTGIDVADVVVPKGASRTIPELIERLPTQALKDHFTSILKGATGAKVYNKIARDITTVLQHPALGKEVEKLVQGYTEHRARLIAPGESVGRIVSSLKKTANVALDVIDRVSPQELRLSYQGRNEQESSWLRARAADAIIGDARLPGPARSAFLQRAATANTEEKLSKLARDIVRASLQAKGFSEEESSNIVEMMSQAGHFGTREAPGYVSMVDPVTGERLTSPQVLAQRVETVKVPNNAVLMQNVRRAILDGAATPEWSNTMSGKVRLLFSKANNNIEIWVGSKRIIAGTAHTIHKVWKFLVVTNATLPIIGAVGGLVAPADNLGQRLKHAGIGTLYGLGFAARPLFRISLLESRIRIALADGFSPDAWIPGWANRRAQWNGVLDDPFRVYQSGDIVRQGQNEGAAFFDNKLMTQIDPGWSVVQRGDKRAPEALGRIVNYQTDPTTDGAVDIALHLHAGHYDDAGSARIAQEVLGDPVPEKVIETGPASELPKSGNIAIDRLTPGNQLRHEITPLTGDEGPIIVQVQPNGELRVVEGNHTLEAYRQAGKTDVPYVLDPNTAGKPIDQLGGLESMLTAQVNPADFTAPVETPGLGANPPSLQGEMARLYRTGKITLDEVNDPAVREMVRGNIERATAEGKYDIKAPIEVRPAFGPPGYKSPAGLASLAQAEKNRAAAEAAAAEAAGAPQRFAEEELVAFLQTNEGKLWAERWAGIGVRPKAAWERTLGFVKDHFTPEMAAERVAGDNGAPKLLSRETLEQVLKEGRGPAEMHVQNTWRMPRSAKELYHQFQSGAAKLAITGPDNAINRRPWANALFKRHYDMLIRNGVDPARAQSAADFFATKRVLEVLHYYNAPSRLSAKLDLFAPFQHARSDMLRVYSQAVLEHPVRSMDLAWHAAEAFNAGKQSGLFVQNPTTGAWGLAIPGSGWLSHHLFGVPTEVNWTADLKSFFFLSGSGYTGINVLPVPGGPIFSVIARELANTFPQLFEGNDAIHKLFFPYGPNGTLISNVGNRLWMGMTGSVPPWEFASKEKWKNELNHWQEEVGRSMMADHVRSHPNDPGAADWRPSQAEVTAATEKFFQAWAVFSTYIPANSYPTFPNKDKYEQAKDEFTMGGTLPWDPQAFLERYPEFTAYTRGGLTEYTGPNDLATQERLNVGGDFSQFSKYDVKTQRWVPEKQTAANTEDFRQSISLGYRQYKSWDQWSQTFDQYAQTSAYYKELDNALHIKGDPAGREQAIADVMKKYGPVAAREKRLADAEKDLFYIQNTYPTSAQADAINRVAQTYGLTRTELMAARRKVAKAGYAPNPYIDARQGWEIADQVQHDVQLNGIGDELKIAAYVAQLPPAEQHNYWQHMQDTLGFDHTLDDASKVLAKDKYYSDMAFGVENAYPWLHRTSVELTTFTPWDYTGSFTSHQYIQGIGGRPVETFEGDRQFDPTQPWHWSTIAITEDDPKWRPGPTRYERLKAQYLTAPSFKITSTTPMSALSKEDRPKYINFLWSQMEANYPNLTKGIKFHLVTSAEAEKIVKGYGSNGVIAFGGGGNLWVNTEAMVDQSAQTTMFVIAKELGQAVQSQFLGDADTNKAREYMKTHNGNYPPTAVGRYLKAIGWNPKTEFKSNQGGYNYNDTVPGLGTFPNDGYGRIFAQALGLVNTGFRISPEDMQALQQMGALPYSHTNDNKYSNPSLTLRAQQKANVNQNVTAAYQQISVLTPAIDAAAKAKNWKAVATLSAKRAQTYDFISASFDSLYNDVPDMTKYYDDLHAASVYDLAGNAPMAAKLRHQAAIDQAAAPMYLTSEANRYNYMSAPVKQAYAQDLIDHLDRPANLKAPSKQYDQAKTLEDYLKETYGDKKLYWEWLTPFQQDLLTKNMPGQVANWQHESDYSLHGAGITSKKTDAQELLSINALLRQYDHRHGKEAPAGWSEFLDLPKNALVKAEYLKSHPEVAQWIKDGPLANMPVLYRELALGTMIKYNPANAGSTYKRYAKGHRGRGGYVRFNKNAFAQSGDFRGEKFFQKPINLQWAIEQEIVWSRRPKDPTTGKTINAPSNYDLWRNMPSGQEKAVFLQQHPEVQQWIKEGPMANMPTEYQAVVRDIMQRYGEWTAAQDPLGKTLTEFFALPGYARDAFLLQHPELEVYFSMTRTPQQQAMNDLTNTYFKIGDVAARSAFLAAHPELQQHFLDARQQRYERFLNQVAVFMGANPEMFQGYLKDQQATLSLLLQRYAEPNLIRETSSANPIDEGPGQPRRAYREPGSRVRARAGG